MPESLILFFIEFDEFLLLLGGQLLCKFTAEMLPDLTKRRIGVDAQRIVPGANLLQLRLQTSTWPLFSESSRVNFSTMLEVIFSGEDLRCGWRSITEK